MPYRFSFRGVYNNVTSAPLFCSLHPRVELLTRALYSEPYFSPQDRRNTHIKRLEQYERKYKFLELLYRHMFPNVN
jgi:hypothetical protein